MLLRPPQTHRLATHLCRGIPVCIELAVRTVDAATGEDHCGRSRRRPARRRLIAHFMLAYQHRRFSRDVVNCRPLHILLLNNLRPTSVYLPVPITPGLMSFNILPLPDGLLAGLRRTVAIATGASAMVPPPLSAEVAFATYARSTSAGMRVEELKTLLGDLGLLRVSTDGRGPSCPGTAKAFRACCSDPALRQISAGKLALAPSRNKAC